MGINTKATSIIIHFKFIIIYIIIFTRIFGCFIKTQIEVKHDCYIKGLDAFVFSLNNNKINKIINPEYALRFYNDYPILIGNNGRGNGFLIYSGEISEGLLVNPKIYDFKKDN